MSGIAKRRKEKGLTQAILAKKLCVDRTTVAKWEAGVSFPKTKMLLELAGVLDITVDKLLKDAV